MRSSEKTSAKSLQWKRRRQASTLDLVLKTEEENNSHHENQGESAHAPIPRFLDLSSYGGVPKLGVENALQGHLQTPRVGETLSKWYLEIGNGKIYVVKPDSESSHHFCVSLVRKSQHLESPSSCQS